MRARLTLLLVLAVGLMGLLALTGCSSDTDEELVIYTGRSQALVEPLVEQFRAEHDVPIEVRYGSDAQMLAALAEEGDRSPADVFWANTTGALGNAAQDNRLRTLPDDILDRPDFFVPSSAQWVPLTARFRVLAYNTDRVDPDDLPDSILDLPEHTELESRIGWTPTYSSFQDFITALRHTQSDDTAADWIRDMRANLSPNNYSSNTPIIQALDAEEIDVGLTNHYYVLRLRYGDHRVDDDEVEPDAPVDVYQFEEGDVGNLALVTGAGLLNTGTQPEAAEDFLRLLLNEEAQSFAAETLNEYPVIEGIEVPDYMLPVSEALRNSPDFDMERLHDIDASLDLLRDQGLL